ncbi:MAG: 2OG-Fe(II) oxygenase family protein [Rickettsiaceae bacterium]
MILNNYKSEDMTIPIIDLDKSNQGDVIVQACINHGFLYIDNRRGQVVEPDIVNRLRIKSKKFFNMPNYKKNEYAIEKSKSLTGYAGFESMTDYVAHSNETIFVHSSNLFPSDKEDLSMWNMFNLDLKQYVASSWELHKKICEHLSPYLDIKNVRKKGNYLKNWKNGFCDQLWVGRFLHYPPDSGVISPHNDVGLLTILNQDQTGGLQVKFKNKWIDVKPIPNTFVVNIGDILQNWSGGLLKSTLHRVKNTKGVDRYSMTSLPLFDKDCEVYIHKSGEWKYPYQHLAERYYSIFKHLTDKVENPQTCLQSKTPSEIDEFHQEILCRK